MTAIFYTGGEGHSLASFVECKNVNVYARKNGPFDVTVYPDTTDTEGVVRKVSGPDMETPHSGFRRMDLLNSDGIRIAGVRLGVLEIPNK